MKVLGIALLTVLLASCEPSSELDCPGAVDVIEGDLAEGATGASDPEAEVEQALLDVMPRVEFVDVRLERSARDGSGQIWHAIDDQGDAVAQVSVIAMNDTFVASTLTACRP